MAQKRPRNAAPPEPGPVTVVNVGYRSTNFWVISAGTSRLLVDLGYPDTMGQLRARMAQMNVPFGEIRYALATHYHLDHAGLAQDLKLAGVPLLLLDLQVPAVSLLNDFMRTHPPFTPITLHDNIVLPCAESRALLARIGIAGEILHTPGHSDDSVSLLLDDGSVFTGDLTLPGFAEEGAAELVGQSWELLASHGARRVYPGHGPVGPLPQVIVRERE